MLSGAELAAQSNAPPILSNLADVAIYPNLTSPPVAFVVGDAETAAEALVVTGSSSDTNVLPASGLIFGGSGSNRFLTLTPALNQRGTSVVTVVVTDLDGGSVSNTFTLRVEEFSPVPTGISIAYAGPVVWGDYDNDDHLDLVSGGTYARVIHNRGDGTFELGYGGFPYYGYQTAANWVDYDRDGRLDLALAGDAWAGMYRNAGDGTFPKVPAFSGLNGMHMGSFCFGDYNNDGSLDALLTGEDINYNDISTLFRNTGTNTLLSQVSFVGVQGSGQLVDLDGDGDLDVVLMGFSLGNGAMTAVYRNDGDGKFTWVESGLPRLKFGAMAWADYDQDGLPDVFLAGNSPYDVSVSGLYHNLGSNTFVAVTAGFPTNMTPIAWGDYDNDGYPDLLASSSAGTRLFHNNGDGTFTDIGVNLPGAAAFADYDNDGDLDIIDTACMTVYRNNCGHSNSPPSVPTGINASVSLNNDVLLTWLPSTDAETTNSQALTYNLRMGTAPGGINIISPQANPTNGFRRVVRPGDIRSNAWTLIDAPRGTYYWSVQAIDSAFAGSRFSAEGSFAITNARPIVSAIADQGASHATSNLTVNFTTYDLETAASNLIVAAFSSNTNVIPNEHLQLGGAGTNRSLTIYPTLNVIGTTLITVTSQDEVGAVYARMFTVNITNALLVLSTIGAQTIPMNGSSPALPFTVSDLETAASNLVITAHSSNQSLLPDQNIVLAGTGTSRSIRVTPAAYQNGSASITLSATDATGGTSTTSFTVTVTQFSDISTGLPTLQNAGMAWGDFDNDGKLDILLAGSGMASIYRNTGNNTFTLAWSAGPGVTNGACAWGDLNNDGNLDFVYAGSGLTRIYANRGDGTFWHWVISLAGGDLPGVSLGSVALADYDGDGYLDILLAGTTSSSTNNGITRLYHNNGDGSFTDANAGLPGICLGTVAWGDYNGDGAPDILLAGYCGSLGSNICRIYRNDGNGTFSDIGANLPGVSSGGAAWGDFDGDGRLDVALTGSTNVNGSGGTLRVYRNLGNGTFQNIGLGSDDLTGGTVTWADFDNDGNLDVIATGRQSVYPNTVRTVVYRNNGQGTFSRYTNNVANFWSSGLALGDYDNDGDLDILVNGLTYSYGGPATKLYRNNLAFTNTAPTVPQNLVASVQANGTLLTWDRSQDAQTTNANGLRYVVRVGSTPGGVDIRSPQAAPLSGFRRLPEPLGGVATNALGLSHLHKGTYYWSVQAIDSSLLGSAFAAESTFMVTNEPPSISTITNQTTTPNQPRSGIAFRVSDAETPAEALTVSGYSLNTNLVPNQNIVFGGSGSNRTVTVTPVNNLPGTAPIVVQVTDEAGATASRQFNLTVEMFPVALTNLAALLNGCAAWGDYDNDGYLDLLICGNLANPPAGGPPDGIRVTKLYHNNGDQTFTEVPTTLPASTFGSVAWGDYDNDGYLDILLTGTTNGTSSGALSRIYRNLGNGAFTNTVSLRSVYYSVAAWADFDNDGRLDVVLAGTSNGSGSGAVTLLYRNNGNGTFSQFGSLAGAYQGAVACGDFDNDGNLDLLVSGLNGNGVAVCQLYRNGGNGAFFSYTTLPGFYNSSLAWGDYDADGYLDILMAGCTNATNRGDITRIYHNNSNRMFTDIQAALPAVQQGGVAWGDVDNDGYLDAVITGTTALFPGTNAVPTVAKIYRNNRQGGFGELPASLQSVFGGPALLADVSNHGALDLLLAGSDGGFTNAAYNPISRLYRNASAVSNSPPQPPSYLSTLVSGRNVTFSWLRAVDLQTTNPPGLSYSLRVGTNSGGCQIVSPPAAPNGARRVARPGDIKANSWRLQNLLPGTYYWSVQAVDNALAGSAFAPEAQVVIPNRPPLANDQMLILSEDTSQPITLTGSEPDGRALAFALSTPPAHGTLSGTPPSLVYVPQTNYFGTDSFTFTVSDGLTNSLPATINLIITPVPDTPGATLSGGAVASGGPFELTMAGEPYERYRIEASEDLKTWVPVTNVFLTNLTVGVVDSDAWQYPHRFYRSAWMIPAAQASVPALLDSGEFRFAVAGEPGRVFQVWVSTNLTDWSPLTTLVLTNTSTWFVDPTSVSAASRFYRLSLP